MWGSERRIRRKRRNGGGGGNGREWEGRKGMEVDIDIGTKGWAWFDEL
jgi:hypothetical protein